MGLSVDSFDANQVLQTLKTNDQLGPIKARIHTRGPELGGALPVRRNCSLKIRMESPFNFRTRRIAEAEASLATNVRPNRSRHAKMDS